MSAHLSGTWLGVALVLTAAAGSLAAGIPLRRGGLLLFLLVVLVATRWVGRAAGYAATATSAVAAAILLDVRVATPATASAWDAGAIVMLALVGAGIATWTGPRRREADDDGGDSRRLKDEFLSTVSHELRTPLNAILGWTELLRMPRGVAPQHMDRGLEVIERNARRQLALVDELLAAADPASSVGEWQRLDVRALVETLVDTLQQPAAAAQVRLRDDDAPAGGAGEGPVWVHGDAAALRVALRHVVENAIKFTPAGGQVHTRLTRSGDRVVIVVSDTGPGIDPRFAGQVFEAFRQQDGSASRPHGGLGLGLTIARKLIERHGGHLDLRSAAPGGGTTFLITLPTSP
jgi:signal transduction histidine kinase